VTANMPRRHARRRTVAGVLATLGAVVSSVAFLTTSSSQGQARELYQKNDVASRRRLLAVAALAAAAIQPQAPVWAAKLSAAADQLEVGGILGKRGPVLNGIWSVVPDTRINDRAVYKKDGADAYLSYNDCGSFQLADDITGGCIGFASESKGKWTVDGQAAKVTVKPVKKVETAQGIEPEFKAPALPSVFGFKKDEPPAAAPAASNKPQAAAVEGSFGQMPNLFGGSSTDDPEELLKGLNPEDDVTAYVRAASKGGGMSGLIQSFRKMDTKEIEIADSLEAKLAKKKVGMAR